MSPSSHHATPESERRIALLGALTFLAFGTYVSRLVLGDLFPLALPVLLAPLALVVSPLGTARTRRVRWAVIGFAAVAIVGTGLVYQMVRRVQTAPYHYQHDGAVQTEDAVTFLTAGVNPYAADYRQTNFGNFIDVWSDGLRPNPAWTHHVYPPFHLLASVPFSVSLRALTGWFDQRVVYLLAAVLALSFVLRLARAGEWRLFVATLFLFNPFWIEYFVVGFNDIFAFAFLAGTVWQLSRRRWVRAGIWYGLAFAAKQSVWPFAPFFFFYVLWGQGRDRRRFWWSAAAFTIAILAFYGPFLVWDARALIDDLYRYPTGGLVTSYPISGIGLSTLLVDWGVISDPYDYFPFLVPQTLVGLPVLAALLLHLRREGTLLQLLLSSTLFTFILWYLSRYFNFNYLSYFSLLVVLMLAVAGPPRLLRGRVRP